MRFSLFILFIISDLIGFSASIPKHLIVHADTVVKDITVNHKKLAEYLVQPAKNDREKVLIFTYWIAKNIKYDLNEVKRLKRNKIAREVLDNKRAVCMGFSQLFEQLCEDQGIVSYTVTGFAYAHFLKRITDKVHMRHAWNVVFVDNKWELLDVTWSIDEAKKKKYTDYLDLKWVFADPVSFSETHFPSDPQWQLLKTPISKREFWSQHVKTEKKASDQADLKFLPEIAKIDAKLASVQRQYALNQNKQAYIKNLIRLAWSCSNGAYDSTKIQKGIELFNLCDAELITTDPFLKKRKYKKAIHTGIYVSQKRLEQKE